MSMSSNIQQPVKTGEEFREMCLCFENLSNGVWAHRITFSDLAIKKIISTWSNFSIRRIYFCLDAERRYLSFSCELLVLLYSA